MSDRADPMAGRNGRGVGQNLAAGLALMLLASFALFLSRNLGYGSLSEIGPGFFPVVLAAILLAVGLAQTTLALRRSADAMGERLDAWSIRGLLGVLGAILLFGLLIRGIDLGAVRIPAMGLIVAGPAAILLSGFADRSTRWRDLLLLMVALTAATVILFRFILRLPIPLAPWLIGY
jgi:hypothetical protein